MKILQKVLHKAKPVLWRLTGELRHGVDAWRFAEWQLEARREGAVVVVIVHELGGWSGYITLEDIAAHSSPGISTGEGMVYWPKEAMTTLTGVGEYDSLIRLPQRVAQTDLFA